MLIKGSQIFFKFSSRILKKTLPKTVILMALLQIILVSTKLIGVIQVNRHGARTGEGFEDLSSKLYFGSKSKQLTINGITQHELLGHYIAEKYIYNQDEYYNILSKEFEEKELKIFSSSIQRAIFSGFGFIKGLYPNSKFKLNFIGKNNNTVQKNYLNLISSDLLTNTSLPILDYLPKRKIPEITLNVLDPENDSIFQIKTCKIKIGGSEENPIYSNNTLKELINLENANLNYTEPLNFTVEEINNAIEEIKEKFPIAFLNELIRKDNTIGELEKEVVEMNINESHGKLGSTNDIENEEKYKKTMMKFLKKVNGFIRFAQFHFGNNFIVLSSPTQLTLNKIQINKAYYLHLSPSKYTKLLHSRIFYEFKNFLLEFLTDSIIDGLKKFKYVVYSGHDFNILGILVNFLDKNYLMDKINNLEENYDFVQPALASHFIIELHSINNNNNFLNFNVSETFVRLIYNGKNLNEGLNEDYFVYNENLKGFEFNNFLRLFDSKVDLEFKNLNCQVTDDDDL